MLKKYIKMYEKTNSVIEIDPDIWQEWSFVMEANQILWRY